MKAINVLKFTGFGLLGLGFVVLAVFVTMSLWNWLIPELFHGPVLTFWQTAGLFILSKILLSGVSPHGGRNPSSKHWHYSRDKWCDNKEHWRIYTEKNTGNKMNETQTE